MTLPRAYATTPQMQAAASKALAIVRRVGLASEEIDNAIITGVADGMDVTPRDVASIYEYFERAGYLETGAVPPPSNGNIEAIVANLYGGSNGLQWSARIIRQIEKELK